MCLFVQIVAVFAFEPRPAFMAPLAEKALIADMAVSGPRMVAVGQYGSVLYSDDGRAWTQAAVPVDTLLTAVTARDGQFWAVGHDTAIIHSSDGGQSWTLQHYDPELEQPLLDIHFFNADQGLAIGAYGLMMFTTDGGGSWDTRYMEDLMTSEAIEWEQVAAAALEGEPVSDEIFDDDLDQVDDDDYYDAEQDFDRGCYEFMECHLNALADLGDGRLLIAAERGYGFRSTDGGESWESFRFDYVGSMFGVLEAGDCLVAFGLRGRVQRSCDFGDSWDSLDTGTQSSLMGAAVRSDGGMVMVGANGDLVELSPDGAINRRSHRLGGDLAAVIQGPEGLIVAGEDGISHDE